MKKTALLTGIGTTMALFAIGGGSVHAETTNSSQNNDKQIIVKVQKGDSLSEIATKKSSTYKRIFYANSFVKDPDVIHPGEKLRIPDAQEQLKERPIPSNAVKQVQNTTKKPAKNKPVATKQQPTQQTRPKTRAQPSANVNGGVWDKLAQCESSGNWSINTGNGYYGGVQFSAATWRSVGGQGLPHQNSKAEQIKRAQILQARSGWGQWPACSNKLGLR